MKVIRTAFPFRFARLTGLPSESLSASGGACFGGTALEPANEAPAAFVWPFGTPVLELELPELPQPPTSNAPAATTGTSQIQRLGCRPAVLRGGVIRCRA